MTSSKPDLDFQGGRIETEGGKVRGWENAVVVMAGLGIVAGLLWLIGNLDEWLQKRRNAPVGVNGRRADGPLAKVVLILVLVAGFIWYVASGGGGIDTEFPYRR